MNIPWFQLLERIQNDCIPIFTSYGRPMLFHTWSFIIPCQFSIQQRRLKLLTRSNYILPPVKDPPTPNTQLCHIVMIAGDVFNTLCNLDQTKAPGPDGLCPIVLKQYAYSLSDPIAKLFNTSLHTYSLPLEWKVLKICPVYKKGDVTSVQNYKPISLLCVISKVLESIIYDKNFAFSASLFEQKPVWLPSKQVLSY